MAKRSVAARLSDHGFAVLCLAHDHKRSLAQAEKIREAFHGRSGYPLTFGEDWSPVSRVVTVGGSVSSTLPDRSWNYLYHVKRQDGDGIRVVTNDWTGQAAPGPKAQMVVIGSYWSASDLISSASPFRPCSKRSARQHSFGSTASRTGRVCSVVRESSIDDRSGMLTERVLGRPKSTAAALPAPPWMS